MALDTPLTPPNSDPNGEAVRKLEEMKKSRFMYRHFIDGLITGNFKPIDQKDVDTIVQSNFFSHAPLSVLDDDKERVINTEISATLFDRLNNPKLATLCGPILESPEVSYSGTRNLYLGHATSSSGHVLHQWTLKDRLKLFDPVFWLNARLHDRGSRPLTSYGNRELAQYGYSDQGWKDLVSSVRQATSKQKLKILDVGCGVGAALHDMKRIDPDCETHGLTIEQEPGMFDADAYHYVAAERMPKDFKEQFDIIVSNQSFRYHVFPAIALKNVVLALSVGGYADIEFDYEATVRRDKHPAFRSYMKRRHGTDDFDEIIKSEVREIIHILRLLQSRGLLEIDFEEDPDMKIPVGIMKIKKLQSIAEKDFTL